MKRRWEVKWYDQNLTQEKCRRFFTEVGALFYAWWFEYKYNIITRVYEL